jgi:hypothetical protein
MPAKTPGLIIPLKLLAAPSGDRMMSPIGAWRQFLRRGDASEVGRKPEVTGSRLHRRD